MLLAMLGNLKTHSFTGRRRFLHSIAGGAAAILGAGDLEAVTANASQASRPSNLKITDLRVANLGSIALIRMDTNQGIHGYGETYTASSKTYPLFLKSRLLGENPCNVDRLFRKIKQFGHHARQASGVTAVEMALWDLAGKAFNVPVYQMLGGKFRDRIRIYADTPQSADPKVFGGRLKKRMEQGFTWLKMDLGFSLVEKTPGTVTHPPGTTQNYMSAFGHMGGWELTAKGIELMSDFVAQVREIVGMQVPLSADHFGHIGVNSCIRLGRALEKHNLAWLEDMVPWMYTDLLKQISSAVDIPLATGEDIYLKEPFEKLCREHAVDIIHPDIACSGGLLETKKIGDMAQEHGVAMAMHSGATPVGHMAACHCAAATENFLALEHHSIDLPWWEDLAEGVEKPIVKDGFVRVSEKPGIGVELNEEVVKKHIREGGFFEPTPQWDQERSHDRLWS
jgi:L-alanine-DL-glutamate epimerase-like enolase superfamily enzyme